MARFACQDAVNCPDCEEFPIRNFSAEAPDQPVFVAGITFGGSPPIGNRYSRLSCLGLCTSTVSQEEADLCAEQAAQLCVWDGGTGGGGGDDGGWQAPVQGDGYRQRTIFGSAEQTCTDQCADGSTFEYVLPSGSVQSVISQADADARAHALCLKRVQQRIVCFVTASPLASANKDSFYSVAIVADGGTGDYTFTLDSGALPPGLTLDPVGLIFGTPTLSATYAFTLRVSDSLGTTNTKLYQLTVDAACDAATDWFSDPGNCRLRIQDFDPADWPDSPGTCDTSFVNAWDGTFPFLFPPIGPGFSVRYSAGSDINATPGFVLARGNAVLDDWTMAFVSPTGIVWIGSGPVSSSPLGVFTRNPASCSGPASLVIEGYSPSP